MPDSVHPLPVGLHLLPGRNSDPVPVELDGLPAAGPGHLLSLGADPVSGRYDDQLSAHADPVPLAGVGVPGCPLDGVPLACNLVSDRRDGAALHHLRTDGLDRYGKTMISAYVTI